MIESYPYGKVFQQRLLAILLKEPEKVLGVLEPQFFVSPIHVEVARIAIEAYREHGTQDFRLHRSTVMEMVKASVSNRDVWSAYKSEVKRLFKTSVSDTELLVAQVKKFANHRRFQEALISAEKLVNSYSYDGARDVVEEAYRFVNSSVAPGAQSSGDFPTWDSLPRFDPNLVRKTKWIVENFVAEQTISLMYGPRGSFKSTFLLALAGAVARGEEYLEMKTRPRRIIYLDYENPPDVIKNRDADLNLNLPENKRLVIWDRFGTQPPPRPGEPRLERLVVHCVNELHRRPWIILDSWASLLRAGEGGESTGQIAPIYAHIRRLCDLGATFTILDHTRKYEADVIYGGQDKEAKADTIHNFVLHENKVRKERPIIRVESWLKRYAPHGTGSFAVEVQSYKDKKGVWHVSGFELADDPVLEEKRKQRNMLRELIKQKPGKSQRELAKLAAALGIGRDKAEELLRAGVGKYWDVEEGAKGKLTYNLVGEEYEQ